MGAWIRACAAGECVGIAAGATASILASQAGGPSGAALLLAGAGVIEGATLGTLQWLVLRRRLPGVTAKAWVALLVVVGVAGWLGSLPAALNSSSDTGSGPPWWLSTLGGAAIGAVAGGLLGLAQVLVLRHQAHGLRAWWLASIGGWAALFAVVMTVAGSTPAGWPLIFVTIAGAVGGLVGGALMGLITAPAFMGLVPAASATEVRQAPRAPVPG